MTDSARELVLDGLRHPTAVRLRLVRGVGVLGDDPVDDAGPQQVQRAHPLLRGQLGGVVGVAVQDRRRALGRQRRQPGVLGADHPVGRHQRQRPAAGALPEQHADASAPSSVDQLGEAAGDLAGHAALLGLLRQRGAGVSMTLTSGSSSSSASRMPRRASRRPAGPSGCVQRLAATVLAEHHAGRAAEPGQRDEQPRVLLALRRCRAAAATSVAPSSQQRPHPGPLGSRGSG